MQIQFSLNAADMSRACRRLGATLSDNSGNEGELIAFNIAAKNVEITSNGTSEGFAAKVRGGGEVSIPCAVLQGVIRTLPYFGRKTIDVAFSDGSMRVASLVFHHRLIVLRDSFASRA
jgi:predicted secreted protein